MEELFDVFDRNDNFLGIKPKSFCHSPNPGVYHKPVWIWIYNDKGEILVQQRSYKKKNFTGLYDMPSAGHVDAGERPIDACVRETEEALGIKVDESEFKYVGQYIKQDAWELAQVYLLNLNKDIDEFTISIDEVDHIEWLKYDEFIKLFNSDKFVPYKEDYKEMVESLLEKTVNNGHIFLLSSRYLESESEREEKELIEKFSKNKSILLVDNATITGSNLPGKEALIKDFKKIATKFGVITLSQDNLKILHDHDVVYITGGDVTPLIELANNSNLAEEIVAFVKNGGIVFGESAGSMIFGKDMKWCYDIKKGTKAKWDKILPTYKGLGFTDINFFPHWNETTQELKDKTAQYEKEFGIKITRVNNGEFIKLR